MRKILSFFVILVLSFSLFASPVVGRVVSTQNNTSSKTDPSQEILYALGNLYNYIDKNYLYEIDNEKMKNEVISAMVSSLGDKYSYFIPKDEGAEDFEESNNGKYVGIGVYITKGNPALIDMDDPKSYMIIIQSPFPGGPAERAGLRPNDLISHINGEDISSLDATEASKKLRGKEGETLTLTIHRGSSTFDISLKPEVVVTPSTEKTIIDGKIGYLKINSFSLTTFDSVQEDVQSLLDDGMKGLIIDLRNNGGGSVDSALNIANMFLPEGKTVMSTEFNENSLSNNNTYTSSSYLAIPLSMPIVLLVDGGTASSSEILTGALQQNGRAVVVGSKTFGKGVMQYSLPFMDGYLNLTVARYKTPNGECIHDVGIMPDYVLDINEEYTEEELRSYSDFLQQDYLKEFLKENPEYTKENILAFSEKYKDSGVPNELLCLLMRNEYIYSLDYDDRPIVDLDFDRQLSLALDIINKKI